MRAGRLAVVLASVGLLAGCSDDADWANGYYCLNSLVEARAVRGAPYVAHIFERSCGGSTDFETHVSILPRGAQVKGPGNVFRAQGDGPIADVGHWGGPYAELRWLSKTQLQIGYDPRAQVTQAETNVSGVTVTYRQATP